MRTLLLIPSFVKRGIREAVAADQHPTMDYHALAAELRSGPDDSAETLDYAAVEEDPRALMRLARRIFGRDAALALAGYLQRRQYDALFTNGENVAIPFALLLKLCRRRPRHVTIGHHLSTPKKRLFYRVLRVHREMDVIFVYASTQLEHGRRVLRIPASKVRLIPFHADTAFFRPMHDLATEENLICSAGLEWRDYPTLIEAVSEMPELKVRLAAASPWSKHRDETREHALPGNVEARRYDYAELRTLYARSAAVCVPLYENDFQAGVTTILEAMAMGKTMIATRTTGQTDVIVHGENGLLVEPGDVQGWRDSILRLREDKDLRERLGRHARAWVEQHATLDLWVSRISSALLDRGPAAAI